MIKKIVYLSVALVSLLFVISCEKDFREIGVNVISNNQFDTKQITLEVIVKDSILEAVRADNLAIGSLSEYLLGVYNNPDYKRIEASIIGQLGVVVNPQTVQNTTEAESGDEEDLDSIYVFNEAVLEIPYTSTRLENESDGKPKFRLDSLLGNSSIPMSLEVFRNGTFLNNLNPGDPTQQNSYMSDATYVESELLNDDPGFTYTPDPTDTLYVVERELSTGETFEETIKLTNSIPFLTVPLNKTRMKELFWDKFSDTEFASQSDLNNYFRGIILKTKGTDGSMVPLSLGTNAPRLKFYYTITRLDEGVVKDTIVGNYTFNFSGIVNSQYKMTAPQNAAPSNSFAIQGTAGSMATINILNGTELQDLRSQNILINDASLVFSIDTSRDTTKVPSRLLIFKNTGVGDGEQIEDSYTEQLFFGGFLGDDDDGKPKDYTIRITDYISNLVSGDSNENYPLILKVYNSRTDAAVVNNFVQTQINSYNWNPRGVTLLNHSSVNGEKRAKLIISYSEEKAN
ncbi:hypothetical protein BTO06_17660 [Tenacibaculum sp. SZ-18]|uniref:DUF4270 family protein n=1 Tax=Tenacibaculum sp. SZ-18 TaxID=754423 RepID=UPI000C2CFFE9|nr:DUF4270 family protein [Tenacibaculum sp. SZ-18]AUC16859.1 hypothetical protein BTO06_17660 [Tenacibaculum sp. SZ-18]